jgi:hypothetical protein
MNIRLDIECSPEEARRFLGLPDLGPVHDVFVGRLRDVMTTALTPAAADDMVRAWLSVGVQGMGAVQKAFWDAARGATGQGDAGQAGSGKRGAGA